MERPIIHITIDEKGEIQQIHGDLRLYEPLTRTHHAPPLKTLLRLTADSLLLPDGTTPNEPLDQCKDLWTVTIAPFVNPEFIDDCPELKKIPTFIQLRSYFPPQTHIDLLVEPNTHSAHPQNTDIQVHVSFNDSQRFDQVLLDLHDKADLQECITTFVAQKDDRRYINDIPKLVRTVIELRRQFHRFRMKLTHREFLDNA